MIHAADDVANAVSNADAREEGPSQSGVQDRREAAVCGITVNHKRDFRIGTRIRTHTSLVTITRAMRAANCFGEILYFFTNVYSL